MKEAIRTYYVSFAVDTIHTETKVKAYSKTDAETLLKKQYANCNVSIIDIEDISEK